ncbi:MAG: hypothetical protein Q4D05_04040 [Acinetobacter sp.]|nr:hypothetical protein [Acinetobacter sp.]
MNKLQWGVWGIAVLILAGYGYKNYTLEQRFTQLQQEYHQSEQRTAQLKDEWIAWQRQTQGTHAANTPASTNSTATSEQLQHAQRQQLLAQLETVQFAIQQGQWLYAVEKLTTIEQQIATTQLADGFKQTLSNVVQQDRTAIQRYAQQNHQQQQLLVNLIQAIDQQLEQSLTRSPQFQPQQNTSFWQNLIRIERVQAPLQQSNDIRLWLQDIRADVQLLKQSLHLSHQQAWTQQLTQIQQKIHQLDEAQQQKFQPMMTELTAVAVTTPPALNSIALFGHDAQRATQAQP